MAVQGHSESAALESKRTDRTSPAGDREWLKTSTRNQSPQAGADMDAEARLQDARGEEERAGSCRVERVGSCRSERRPRFHVLRLTCSCRPLLHRGSAYSRVHVLRRPAFALCSNTHFSALRSLLFLSLHVFCRRRTPRPFHAPAESNTLEHPRSHRIAREWPRQRRALELALKRPVLRYGRRKRSR
jgi:hypothetical protein